MQFPMSYDREYFQTTVRPALVEAKALHQQEKEVGLRSIELVGRFERGRVALNLGLSTDHFARLIGLTPETYWKRAQVARSFDRFPMLKELVLEGKTYVSHVSMVAGKLTEANYEKILATIPGKSRREIQLFLSRLGRDGSLASEVEATVEVKLILTKSQIELLDRAREVLAHGGKVPTNVEIIEVALKDSLKQRDPMERAKRTARRRVNPLEHETIHFPGNEEDHSRKNEESLSSLESDPAYAAKEAPVARPRVPAAIRHRVWIRDRGQCTWRNKSGTRCKERMMLELDHHHLMWCRGGRHSEDNLTLRCRHHNQFSAEQALGRNRFF